MDSQQSQPAFIGDFEVLDELVEELTRKFLMLNSECECAKLELSIEVAKHQVSEAHYKSEAARFTMLQAENLLKGQQRMTIQAANIVRPSTSMPVEVTYNSEDWLCKNGDVCGIGVTPETACQDFDRQWLGKDVV